MERRALSSFTTAVGFALGELLLLTGTPDKLLEHLGEIHVTARATLIASDTEPVIVRRPAVSLSDAALKAVSAWNADPQDPATLDDAMALLAEVLEEVGVLRIVASDDG